MPRETQEEQPYSLREIRRLLEAPLRRPLLVILPLVVTVVATVAVSFLLAPRYSSSTLILVAPDRVPSNLVQTVTTETIARRLQTLRQEVQSRTRLEVVAKELDPYGILASAPIMHTIEQMREAVTVEIKGKDAFSIEFEHTDPKMAMLVADRLTTLFMEEVVGQRERQVSEAYKFIETQLEEAREELEVKESALREFKQRHMGTLPEQVNSNLATLQRLQMEHQTVADNLRQATDTLLLLESGLTPTGARASSGSGGVAMGPADTLGALRAALKQHLTRYTPEHPDIVSLKARIATLEKEVRAAAAAGPQGETEILDPAQAQARAQVVKARNEVQRYQERLAGVERRIASFQARVEAAPQREQEIVSLTRDYQKLGENYTGLLSKKLDAEMSARLELYSKGQQFRVIDPAYMPERPSFPNHGLFALGGALGGLLLGIGLASVVDILDPTVKDLEDVRTVLSFPVVAVMPHVTPKDAQRLAAAGGGSDEPRRPVPANAGSDDTRRPVPNAGAHHAPRVDSGKGRNGKRRTVPFRPRLRGGGSR